MADISQVNLPNDSNNPYNITDANVPHSSLAAASGGTDLSLVTTGEKYTWNNGSVDTKVTQTDMSDVILGGEHCLVFAESNDTPTKTEGLGKTKYIQCIAGPTYEISGLVFRDNNNDAKMGLYADGILTNQQVWTKRVMANASGQGTSYVNPDHKAAVYVKKDYQTNQWFPFAMTQTYGGGQWSIGTYNNEELLFVYTTKYNVDNNVNTNQMWRLQLAKNDNSSADNKIITSNNFTSTNTVNTNTLSEVFVRSSGGTAIEAAFRRWGKVCTLYLHFKTTATTSGGGNMIVGKTGSAVTPYLPPMIVTAGSYYSSMALGGHLASDGSITVRNASSSNIGAQSSGFRMTWTWVY